MSALQELRGRYADVRRRLYTVPARPMRRVEIPPAVVVEAKPYVPPPTPLYRATVKNEWQGPLLPMPFGPEKMARQIAAEHGVTLEEVREPGRKQKFVPAREEIARALRSRGWSFPRIARFLGRTDHTTAIHWVRGRK